MRSEGNQWPGLHLQRHKLREVVVWLLAVKPDTVICLPFEAARDARLVRARPCPQAACNIWCRVSSAVADRNSNKTERPKCCKQACVWEHSAGTEHAVFECRAQVTRQ